MESTDQLIIAKSYKFELSIFKVSLLTGFPCTAQIEFHRGSKKIESKQKLELDSKIGEVTFNEKLASTMTFYYDVKRKAFQEKECKVNVILTSNEGKILGGLVEMNLAKYLNKNLTEKSEVFHLEKCPDNKAQIQLKLKFIYQFDLKPETSQFAKGLQSKSKKNKSTIDIKQMQALANADKIQQEKQQVEEKLENKEIEISHLQEQIRDLNIQLAKYESSDKIIQSFQEKVLEQAQQIIELQKENIILKDKLEKSQEHQKEEQ